MEVNMGAVLLSGSPGARNWGWADAALLEPFQSVGGKGANLDQRLVVAAAEQVEFAVQGGCRSA